MASSTRSGAGTSDRPPRRRQRGRPRQSSGLRQSILTAAQVAFSRNGYDRATLRQIAREAEVDVSLINHYFGSKAELFAATMTPPVDVAAALPEILRGDPAEQGLRVARFVVATIDDEATRNVMLGAIRASASEPRAAEVLRETLSTRIIQPLARQLQVPDPQLRAALFSSQIVGLVMARYVVGVEPLASTSSETLAEQLAPVAQQYLTSSTPRRE